MGFYFNLSSAGLHTDECTAASDWADTAKTLGRDNWLWFETYTEAYLKSREGGHLAPHSGCGPKPDDVDRRVIAVYEALRHR